MLLYGAPSNIKYILLLFYSAVTVAWKEHHKLLFLLSKEKVYMYLEAERKASHSSSSSRDDINANWEL